MIKNIVFKGAYSEEMQHTIRELTSNEYNEFSKEFNEQNGIIEIYPVRRHFILEFVVADEGLKSRMEAHRVIKD